MISKEVTSSHPKKCPHLYYKKSVFKDIKNRTRESFSCKAVFFWVVYFTAYPFPSIEMSR